MNYGKLITAISTVLMNSSRAFTRYNDKMLAGAKEVIMHNGFNYDTRSVKMVVADYQHATKIDCSFHLKVTQVINETVVATNEVIAEYLSRNDQHFAIIQPDPSAPPRSNTVVRALEHAKLKPGAYFSALCEIFRQAQSNCAMKRQDFGNTTINYPNFLVAASSRFGNECVYLIVQQENMVEIIEFKE